MKKLYFIWPLFLVLLFSCKQTQPVLLQGRTMGTTYHIKIVDEIPAPLSTFVLQQQIDSLLAEINRQMSTYISTSEISQFNKFSAGKPFKVSQDFIKVLHTAMNTNRESGGAFDVTVEPLVNLWGFGRKGKRAVPPDEEEIANALHTIGTRYVSILGDTAIIKDKPNLQLDFGAIAKGYGVDAVAKLLARQGLANFMVEIGGELKVNGQKGKEKWKIGIDRPEAGLQPGEHLQSILHIKDMAMATSGDYRNYFRYADSIYTHEIDPRTGRPIQNSVASVTVIAPSCMIADAMATAIMVMGAEAGMKWIEAKKGIETLIILHDGKNFKEMQSSGLKNYLN